MGRLWIFVSNSQVDFYALIILDMAAFADLDCNYRQLIVSSANAMLLS